MNKFYLLIISIPTDKNSRNFNINNTDGTLCNFKKENEMNWRNERNLIVNNLLIIFQFGPNPSKIYQFRSNLNQNKKI